MPNCLVVLAPVPSTSKSPQYGDAKAVPPLRPYVVTFHKSSLTCVEGDTNRPSLVSILQLVVEQPPWCALGGTFTVANPVMFTGAAIVE